ncbi:hypothetical protein [Anoxynatronum buryatiense]|uniref:Uncharacterized protein n=1 Tax=Anoxynatronum buryatiense TaxID=489973 RepID=A0AA45WW59_9CLOT|nr:hypothetical protein [Anoxynatronum buryatiense]SMP56579.1 hypothetical protein SAMN06296020_10682 [Anoxynatronum buryatiense]
MKNNSEHQTHSMNTASQFLVDIRYQQHHSWQGSIQRLDTGEKINFRSALELITLIQAALGNVEEADDRNWTGDQKEVNELNRHQDQSCSSM